VRATPSIIRRVFAAAAPLGYGKRCARCTAYSSRHDGGAVVAFMVREQLVNALRGLREGRHGAFMRVLIGSPTPPTNQNICC